MPRKVALLQLEFVEKVPRKYRVPRVPRIAVPSRYAARGTFTVNLALDSSHLAPRPTQST
eukprot:scaffold87865_cov64-Cyclotella_meneghiniana.AAC.1